MKKYIDLDTKFITGGGSGGSTTFSGDLSGFSTGPQTVKGLQNRPVSNINPEELQVLQWSGGSWSPATIAGASAAPKDASYLTLAITSGLDNERVLTAGTNISFVDDGSGSTLTINNTYTLPSADLSTLGGLQLAGDLSGSAALPVVNKLKGVELSATPPTNGQILTASSGSNASWQTLSIPDVSDATTSSKGIVQLSGDLTGSAATPRIAKLQNVNLSTTPPTNGQILQYNGGLSQWMPTDSASGAPQGASYLTLAADGTLTNERVLTAGTNIAFVDSGAGNALTINNTYTLPNATSSVTGGIRLAGQLGGTATAPTVLKINNATVPAAGSLTTGHVLQVSGASALSYSAINLANVNSVTGVLSSANLPDASSVAKGILNLSGDLGGTSTSPSVLKINGVNVSGTCAAGYVITGVDASTAAWTTLPSASTGSPGLLQLNNDLAGTSNSPNVIAASGASGIFNVKCHTTRNASTAKVEVINKVLPQVQTTNATLTTLYTFALTNNAINKVSVEVIGIRNNVDQGAAYDLACTVRADAGVYNLIGSISSYASEDDPDWHATLALSGSNLLIQVTGKAATTIGWSGSLHCVITTF